LHVFPPHNPQETDPQDRLIQISCMHFRPIPPKKQDLPAPPTHGWQDGIVAE